MLLGHHVTNVALAMRKKCDFGLLCHMPYTLVVKAKKRPADDRYIADTWV